MAFKPGKEHDYIVANVAYILRNAQALNRTANETQFIINERMKELGLNPDSNWLDVYFEREIARNVFKKESEKQQGKVRKEFIELSKLPYYSFEKGVSEFIEATKSKGSR